MARPKTKLEDMVARFAAGTFERIAKLLRPGEVRADFVREAVDREISRRERAVKREADASGGAGVRLKEKGGE